MKKKILVVDDDPNVVNYLVTLFEDNEYLSARQLVRLIHPLHEGGFKGNLHDQAWDVADRLIAKMRNE